MRVLGKFSPIFFLYLLRCNDSTTWLENIAVTALAQNANDMRNTEIAVNRKFWWDLIWEIWANGTVRLLKSDWLTYKVNRNMLRISVIRLWGRIEGAALITFNLLIQFRNLLNSWMKKYWIYYILGVRPNARLMFFRRVLRRVHVRLHTSQW